MFTFSYIAEKELGWKKKKINEVREELDRKVEFHTLIKEMNKHIGDIAVFYYGVGDEDEADHQYLHDTKPNRGTPAKKRASKKKKSTDDSESTTSKKKKSSSQEAFDENLRKQVAKDYKLKGGK